MSYGYFLNILESNIWATSIGTAMHPLYPLLNPELTNTNSPDFDSLVRMILLMEDALI